DAFLKETVSAERDKRAVEMKKLENAHSDSQDKLEKLLDNLKRQTKETGTSQSNIAMLKQHHLISTLSEKTKESHRVQRELTRLQMRLAKEQARLKAGDELPVPEAELEEAVEADAIVKESLFRKKQIQDKIEVLEIEGWKSNESFMISLRKYLKSAEKALEKTRTEVRERLVSHFRKKVSREIQTEVARIEEEIGTYQKEHEALVVEVKRLNEQADKIGNSSTEMETLRLDITKEERLVTRLGDQLRILQVELGGPPRVSLYQKAAIQKKDIKRQPMGTIIAPVTARGGAAFFVAW